MLQLRYADNRLAYADLPLNPGQIFGGQVVNDLVWSPSVYVANEWSSVTYGNGVKDLLLSVDPRGIVVMNTRLEAILNCELRLEKFPFDVQECPLVFESCRLNRTKPCKAEIKKMINFFFLFLKGFTTSTI